MLSDVLIPCVFLFLSGLNYTTAVPRNVTVDDEASDGGVVPVYLPGDYAWTQGATCSSCGVQPLKSRAYNSTWHDTTNHPEDGADKQRAIEVSFNGEFTHPLFSSPGVCSNGSCKGTAVYVYFIIANTVVDPGVDTSTYMNFIVDNEPVGSYSHEPAANTRFRYDVLVYYNDTLPAEQHLLRMEAAETNTSLILFDYLAYT